MFRPLAVVGFAASVRLPFALGQQWSLQEFCWSTWLAALVFSWACVATAGLNIDDGATTRPALEERFPPEGLARGGVRAMLLAALALGAAAAAFGFTGSCFPSTGCFLSVFAEMEPALRLFATDS
ncbi:MAG: hypothetical protein IPK56_11285 [Elusimicrobia bacterium]|nr:hypothetical protein [Elusimicrobiota bacterium]